MYEEIAGWRGGKIKAWTAGVEFEFEAQKQVHNIAGMPFIHGHVAVMPDVHAGIGATVGSVIPTKGAIVPAAVGVDIGCFTGDTLIPLFDGKSHRIDSLVGRDDLYVFAFDHEKGLITAAMASARKTRSSAKLVEVTLDDGSSIRCTPDHRFMLRDGSYLRADKLSLGSSLMPYYTKFHGGYQKVKQPKTGGWQAAHWIMGRSGLMGPIPKGKRHLIHHVSFMDEGAKANNVPSNLRFMTFEDHSKLHAEMRGGWKNSDPDFQAKRLAGIKRRSTKPEEVIKMAEVGKKNLLRYMSEKRSEYLEKIKGNGKRGKPYLDTYNKSDKGREKSREIGNRVLACPVCDRKIKGYAGLGTHIKTHGVSTLKEARAINHKVVSVRALDHLEDVYCLTVPGHENFALTAGVFVHNCGVLAFKTSLKADDLPDGLSEIRSEMERAVPHGGLGPSSGWGGRDVPGSVQSRWKGLEPGFKSLCERYPHLEKGNHYVHLGSLGGGNHFIEMCLDLEDSVWIMIHSGSRGIGNLIGRTFIDKARELLEKRAYGVPDKDLAWLDEGTPEFRDYTDAMLWAQDFAMENRKAMMERALKVMHRMLPPFTLVDHAINCHHNFAAREEHGGESIWVTRKGAVSAKVGELGVIPGSMGARSYVVRGKGNEESWCSCSHGAGRRMSRGEAKRRFTVEDHVEATKGIECRKDAGVIDETPGAYKDIDAIMSAQEDLVEVVAILKQVLCIKG